MMTGRDSPDEDGRGIRMAKTVATRTRMQGDTDGDGLHPQTSYVYCFKNAHCVY